MKTIEQMAKGNALVAVKNEGENVLVVVTDSKNIGKIVAQMGYANGNFVKESPELEGVKVVDVKPSIYRKISKIVKSVSEGVTFKADDENLKKLTEVLADENNLYDLNAILAGTELGKRTVFLVEKDGAFGLAKTSFGRKSATAEKLKEAGYNTVGRFDVENQINFVNVGITMDELIVLPIDETAKEYVVSLIPAKEEGEQTAAEGESEQPAEAEQAAE